MTDSKFTNEDKVMFKELFGEAAEKASRRGGVSRVNFQEEELKYWLGWLPEELGRRAGQIKSSSLLSICMLKKRINLL